MLTQLRNYLANLSSNLDSFSKAVVESSTSLLNSQTVEKIINPVITISFEDFLPAVMVYFFNNGLQSSFHEHQDSNDDPSESHMALIATAATINIVLTGFIIKIRSYAEVCDQ